GSLTVGAFMTLRKSPTLTPALLASNRQNAKKSTGPRTARGKAWSRLNRLRHGTSSLEFINFCTALSWAPPGPAQVAFLAHALLASKPVQHAVFVEVAELSIQAEIELCGESERKGRHSSEKKALLRSKPEC